MKLSPPKLAEKLLHRFLRTELIEEVSGDLEEKFYATSKRSIFKARLNYWYQVINYIRPFAIKKSRSQNSNPTIMLRHNLTIAFRNFARFKSSFFINLIGLSTGLACAFMIYLWAADELSVDKFNDKDQRLFRAMEFRTRALGIWTAMSSPGPLADALVADMPDVEMAAQVTWPNSYTLSQGERNFKVKGRYAAKDYFKMFSYKLLSGDSTTVLSDKSSIVISDHLAQMLFNSTENCIGKTVEFEHQQQYQVSGVFRMMPINASEQFEFVLPWEVYKSQNEWLQSWGNTGLITTVLLKPGVDINTLNGKLTDYIRTKTNGEIKHRTLFLKRYSDEYLYGNYENGVLTGGRIMYVKLFSMIAVFILIIAAINFMNLSTARASRRMKEVGIKKTMGAGRRSLVLQYFGESLLMSALSMLIAAVLTYILLPEYNAITGKQLVFDPTGPQFFWMLAITGIAGLLAGSYPALYLSGFQPASILKGRINGYLGEAFARKSLVTFQFALSIIFIVLVVVVYKQIEFVQSADLGYHKDNVISFSLSGAFKKSEAQELLIARAKALPSIEAASSMSHNLAGHNGGTSNVAWEGKDPEDKTEFERFVVNYDLIEALDMQMAAGRSFSREFKSDSAAIIFNQKAIEFMELKDPIGKTVKLWDHDRKIIGVVNDFHYESLHEKFKPLFIIVDPNDTYNFIARITPGRKQEAIDGLEKLYQSMNPGFSFDYKFLSDDNLRMYAGEQRIATLSKYFAGLAILISCLGLFGLAAFTAERRLKEIGIRKVLGSNELAIVSLLAGDFTKLVLIAIFIAIPISYFGADWWLAEFAFRISLHASYFINAGIAGLLIAWLTVGFQSIKAAKANPTQCLRSE